MMSPRKRVMISVLNQGSIRIEIVALLLHLTRKNEFDIIIDFPCEKPISHNRNQTVKRFLESDADYLLFLDGDIVPPQRVLDLMKYDFDVIGALCFAYKGTSINPLVLKRFRQKNGKIAYRTYNFKDPHGVQEVDAIGTGCMLIARRVLEDVKAPFINYYDRDGIRTIGLDLAFCEKAKKLGYKVWVDLDMNCAHWTTIDLRQVYQAFSTEIKPFQMKPNMIL